MLVATLSGLAVGGLGIGIQFIAAPEKFGGVPIPPGLYFLAGAALVVWSSRRWRWSPLVAVLLAFWILFGGLRGGQLIANLDSLNGGLIAGVLVMLLGLLLTIVGGIWAGAVTPAAKR
jgi:hypothetical protein